MTCYTESRRSVRPNDYKVRTPVGVPGRGHFERPSVPPSRPTYEKVSPLPPTSTRLAKPKKKTVSMGGQLSEG